MKFTVVWVGTAEQGLTKIWTAATDRKAVTDAAHAIDRALQTNPHQVGESRNSGQRILFAPPLAVTYVIRPEDRLVRVLHIWTIRPKQR